jgi:hypothetical protein
MPERCKHATLWRRAAMELTKDADYKTKAAVRRCGSVTSKVMPR